MLTTGWAQPERHTQAAVPHIPGWIKTFAEDVTPVDGAIIAMPASYESVLESDVRKDIMSFLQNAGYVIVERDAGPGEFALSYHVDVAEGARRRLPQSPIGIGPSDAIGQTEGFGNLPVGDGVAPRLILNRDKGSAPTGPSVDLRLILHDDGKPIWTAYGGAVVGTSTRSIVAKSVVTAMLKNLGKAIDEQAVAFPLATKHSGITIVDPGAGAKTADEE